VQVLPGSDGRDGDLLNLTGGDAVLDLAGSGARTLAVTALPVGAYDADTRPGRSFPVSLVLGPADASGGG